MERITALNPETAEGKSKDLFEFVMKKLGMVPNMMRVMGHSPAVLSGYLSFNQALDKGAIGAKLAALIALTVANQNKCEYCTIAHTFIAAKMLGVDPDTIRLARTGKASNKKTQAALRFVIQLMTEKGNISVESIDALRKEGFSDGEITEVIAHTALNILTNFISNAALVQLDFPVIS